MITMITRINAVIPDFNPGFTVAEKIEYLNSRTRVRVSSTAAKIKSYPLKGALII